LASFDFDQAEGLRRMLAGSRPRVFTFLSAASDEDKAAMLVNLGASLARIGSNAVVLDASTDAPGIVSRLNLTCGATLAQVARGERSLGDAVLPMPQGFGIAQLARGEYRGKPPAGAHKARLEQAFGDLAARSDILVVDGELNQEDDFPVAAMAGGEIVVQVSTSAASIKSAYALIKRLSVRLGRRSFSIVVTGASEAEALRVHQNMAQAASRYLALPLNSMGSVPADEHLKRAARLGRSVVDAFPLAGASVAFRKLAGRFALSEMPAAQWRGGLGAGFGA
jgi:flagellar biosynthesis protein FlhG